nr:hypothetical protein NCPCFENI_00549 [Cupriavidus sp.]
MTRFPSVVMFCKVIDNFGDIGVCLRLALGLIDRGCAVTLVTDRPDLAGRMDPTAEVKVLEWDTAAVNPHSVDLTEDMLVIEAFQVTPPLLFLQACPPKLHRICLDYLATEAWAEGLQGMPAPDPAFTAHSRIWLAPSFSGSGPGLIRGRWEEIDTETRAVMRGRLIAYGSDRGMPYQEGHGGAQPLPRVAAANEQDTSRVFLVLVFGYEDAPWDALAQVMAGKGLSGESLTGCGLPEGFDRICFVKPLGLDFSQREFDAVLQSCDLNFVRGEDSFVRAHYAAVGRWQVPFVWQPYRQAAGAHLDKLAAWQQHLIHAEELRWASTQQVSSLAAGRRHSLGDVWQSWLGLEAFFNPVPDASAPLVAPTSSAAPWPLARPVCLASQEHSELPTPLLRSWQQLQQNWDLFRTTFSDACQRLIPGQSLETTLLRKVSDKSDF